MTDRLRKIFDYIAPCAVFADIGCDHGYIAHQMIKSGKCSKVIIADVSAKCLSKAERLLTDYIDCGRAESVVSDGFDNLPDCDVALIAGMGGREIMSIINKAVTLPERLVLQPMKNAPQLRATLLEKGYKISVDVIFFSASKFYNLITCERGKDSLTDDELEFGRTNIKERPADFTRYIEKEIDTLEKVLKSNVGDEEKEGVLARLKRLKKYA